MDEPVKKNIQDLIEYPDSLIAKIIIFTDLISSGNKTKQFLNEFIEKHEFSNEISGLLLVYPTNLLCLIESTEEILYKVCYDLLKNNEKIFKICRHFPMHISTNERFFRRWYIKKIEILPTLPDNLLINNTINHLHGIKLIYNQIIENIYKFYWQFKSINDAVSAK